MINTGVHYSVIYDANHSDKPIFIPCGDNCIEVFYYLKL